MGHHFEWGSRTNAPNAATARNDALANCNRATNGSNDCRVEVEFSAHRCAAIMANRAEGSFAWGRGNSEAEAESEGLNKLSNGGSVLVAKCNSSSGTAAFVPESIRARSEIVGNETSPIVIYNSSIESRSDRTYNQCLCWRNISRDDALSKCNRQTGGANNCAIMLKFSGSNKCAALAVDGTHFGTGKGPDLNNTIATALANLRANEGNIGNNIVASPCNSR